MGEAFPGRHHQGLKNLPQNCWNGVHCRVNIHDPRIYQSCHLNHQKKKLNFCEYVVMKVSFLSSFVFLGGWFISTALPCSSALAKNFLEKLMGCHCCCFA